MAGTATTTDRREHDEGNEDHGESRRTRGAYVYGIVPADVETDPEVRGLGDPPGEITVVRHGDVAALVSDLTIDRPLGTPEDLRTHAEILDATAAEVPVLPLRFGAVLTDTDAVSAELLAEHHDEFAAALTELEGKAEYIVKGRYDERAVLAEILSENGEAQRLRDAIRDKPEEATRNERIALGELIANTITAKREQDTRTTVAALEKLGLTVAEREPTHERDAVYVACLADTGAQADLENLVDDLAGRWGERVDLRLLGPLAAYDFVLTARQGG
ncbi:GvpL/GvpF family gas vesicle protein [Saccharomonospora piscinae]|uniref:GvpL/GvpF family gas vesicle protein n=1 Tax=Saccharomonospora piscinae TaxID=687388 RepID=UPI000463558E|nr:GvpL/GvpF family gas vesicle protein [Saccharomonospora piscinae]